MTLGELLRETREAPGDWKLFKQTVELTRTVLGEEEGWALIHREVRACWWSVENVLDAADLDGVWVCRLAAWIQASAGFEQAAGEVLALETAAQRMPWTAERLLYEAMEEAEANLDRVELTDLAVAALLDCWRAAT